MGNTTEPIGGGFGSGSTAPNPSRPWERAPEPEAVKVVLFPPVLNPTITVAPSHSAITSCKATTAFKVVQEIMGEKHKPAVDAIRSAPDKDTAKKLKGKLPVILWHGEFRAQKTDGLVNHSGLICVDLDLQDHGEGVLESKRAELCDDPHVFCLFSSPSGGLKVVLKIRDINAENHKTRGFPTAKQWAESHGLVIDEACKDIPRRCYISHDPDVYYNSGSVSLQMVEAEEVRQVNTTASETPCMEYRELSHSEKVEEARSALEAIPRQSHDEWKRLIAATIDAVGATDALALLKATHKEEEEGEYEKAFRNPMRDIKAATLFHMAREHGWSYSPPLLEVDAATDAAIDKFVKSSMAAADTAAAQTSGLVSGSGDDDATAQPSGSIWDTIKPIDLPDLYVDLNEDPAEDDFKAFLKGVPVAEDADLVVISARLKSFKSSVVAALACSLVAGDDIDCLGMNIRGDGVFLIFDTEQSTKDIQSQARAMRRRLGVDTMPERIKIVGLRELAPRDRIRAIKGEIDKHLHRGIAGIVVDGVSDLAGSVNDDVESSNVVNFLTVAASRAQCPVFGVIHLNHSDREALGGGRGHLGKEMERKAKSVICIEKGDDDDGTIYAATTRKKTIPKKHGQRIRFCEDQMMVVSESQTPEQLKEDKEREELRELLYRIQDKTGVLGWTRSDLNAAIGKHLGQSKRSAQRHVKRMIELCLLKHDATSGNVASSIGERDKVKTCTLLSKQAG